MPKTVTREAIDAAFPRGPFWLPKVDGDYDKLLDGISDADLLVYDDLSDLARIRNPQTTPYLSDLEKEYGILPNPNLTEQVRRDALQSKMTEKSTGGRLEPLQSAITDSGFTNLLVHANDPPVDPAIFLDQSFQMVAGGDNAYAGRSDAFAGRIGGNLVVNGDIFTQQKAVLMQAGGDIYAGNTNAVAGYFEELKLTPQAFELPTDPGYWPLFFFVGGAATRDGSGALTEIATETIDADRRTELISLIVRFKPSHSWCGLIVEFT